MNLPTNRMLRISLCYYTALATLITYVMIILQHPDHRDSPILFLVYLRGLQIRHILGRIEAPLPPLRPRPKRNFIHPRQLSSFPERLELPFSNDEILCGYEDIVSSGTDHFTAWVKVSPHEVLVQHMVDIQRATADFREASQRRPATSSHTNSVNKHFATRGKEDAFEKQIAGRWHIITLQDASESADFSNHWVLIDFGKCACMMRYPSHEEHSACDLLIKVAIMKLGFIWISSTGATLGTSKASMIGTFLSKNDLQIVHTGPKNDVLAKS